MARQLVSERIHSFMRHQPKSRRVPSPAVSAVNTVFDDYDVPQIKRQGV
jgi:hypothetical protein